MGHFLWAKCTEMTCRCATILTPKSMRGTPGGTAGRGTPGGRAPGGGPDTGGKEPGGAAIKTDYYTNFKS